MGITEEPELPSLSSVENQVELEATRAALKSGKKTVAYKQEPKPEVRKSTGEAHFAVEKAALLESSGRFAVKPAQEASLSRRESAVQLEEPEKEQVTLSMVRQNTIRVAGVAKDAIVLTKGKSATAFKPTKALKQRLVRDKSMTKYETPVVEPAKLSAVVSSTQLAEPQKEVVRTIRSKSFVAFKAPVVVPAKLALGEAATAYELVQKVEEAPKLARSRSAIKLKYTKVVAPEPIKLALSEDATELAEPQKPVVEAVKLVRSKSATVLKEPQKVVPKPVKLALTESATELKEPAEKVEEPVKLARTRSAIRMRVPAKKVIKLLEGGNDFTHKTRKASLSSQVGGTSFSAKKVVEEPAQLTKGSEDVTVTEKKQKLVAVNKVVSYKQSKQVLVLSNTSVDQEKVAVVLSNTSRDFARDELVSTENGLDVEEEYDWSYLKWYAGGVATQYLLGGRGSVRHVHHNSKKSGRKEYAKVCRAN